MDDFYNIYIYIYIYIILIPVHLLSFEKRRKSSSMQPCLVFSCQPFSTLYHTPVIIVTAFFQPT